MREQPDGIAMGELVAGTETTATRPVTGGIERGGVLLVEGQLAERRLLAATLAGWALVLWRLPRALDDDDDDGAVV